MLSVNLKKGATSVASLGSELKDAVPPLRKKVTLEKVDELDGIQMSPNSLELGKFINSQLESLEFTVREPSK